VDGTAVRDFHDSRTLILRKLAYYGDIPFNEVEQRSVVCLTICAILRVHPMVAQMHAYLGEWPAFPSRIQRDRHRRASTERRKQQIVRAGARISTALCNGLV